MALKSPEIRVLIVAANRVREEQLADALREAANQPRKEELANVTRDVTEAAENYRCVFHLADLPESILHHTQLVEPLTQRIEKHRIHCVLVDSDLLSVLGGRQIGDRNKLYEMLNDVTNPASCLIYTKSASINVLQAMQAFLSNIGFLTQANRPSSVALLRQVDRKIFPGRHSTPIILQSDVLEKAAERCNLPFDEIEEALQHLFAGYPDITIEPISEQPDRFLDSTWAGSSMIPRQRSIVLYVSFGAIRLPGIIKIARREKIQREIDNYNQYIRYQLRGLRHTQMESSFTLWTIGVIAYSFIGGDMNYSDLSTEPNHTIEISDRQARIRPFSVAFRQILSDKELGSVNEAVKHFFHVTWNPHYKRKRPTSKDQPIPAVLEGYRQIWGNGFWNRVTNFPNQSTLLDFPSLQLKTLNPVLWVIKNGHRRTPAGGYLATTHGDLHGENLLVDELGHCWVIDFERSGDGPVLQDFVELETDIATRLLDPQISGNWSIIYEFFVAMATFHKLDRLPVPYRSLSEFQLYKAMTTINTIREVAYKLGLYTDRREYLWGLLLNALFRATYLPEDHPQQKLALFFGGVVCQRLSNWLSADSIPAIWPPSDWPQINWVPGTKDIYPPTKSDGVIRVLFLAANPSETEILRLDREYRQIQDSLEKAKLRDRFELVAEPAVRRDDLIRILMQRNPVIVHFSGHGNEDGEIIVEDEAGYGVSLPQKSLADLFATLNEKENRIRCVLLNACFTEQQAQRIVQHVDAVIGMSSAIEDNTSIRFVSAFYSALGENKSVKLAYDLGCRQIGLSNPEQEGNPRLLSREGLDPSKLYLP